MTKSITTLYADFEQALAVMAGQRSKSEEEFDSRLAKATKLADDIVWCRAHSVAEMLLKIQAAGWLNGTLERLDHWTECADMDICDCVASLRDDLLAMQAAPSRRARRTNTQRPLLSR